MILVNFILILTFNSYYLNQNSTQEMEDSYFWTLINNCKQDDNDKFKDCLIEQLYCMSDDQIISFERNLRIKILELNTWDTKAVVRLMYGTVTDDDFLYFKCWVISQGKIFFDEFIENPDKFSSLFGEYYEKGIDPDAEYLLYVSDDAYEKKYPEMVDKNIDDFDNSYPRMQNFSDSLHYDINHKLVGIPWINREDIKKRLPNMYEIIYGLR